MIRRVKIDFQRALTAPEGAHEVLLVRHGACDPPAADGLIGGRSDPSLNERGRGEAAAVDRAAAAASRSPRCSPRRCGAPARPRRRPPPSAGSSRASSRDLVEIYLGEWEGHGIHERGARGDAELARVLREQRWELIPGAEPRDEFARAGAARRRAGRRRGGRRRRRRRLHPLGRDRRVLPPGHRRASPSPSCTTATAR